MAIFNGKPASCATSKPMLLDSSQMFLPAKALSLKQQSLHCLCLSISLACYFVLSHFIKRKEGEEGISKG